MSNTAQSAASTRIASLLDANSFVEIGGQITARSTDFNLSAKETPSDGVITGYGVIDGSLVYVYSQDATVLNGTVGEMHAKKRCTCDRSDRLRRYASAGSNRCTERFR